jgi:hypothetical protein
MPCGSDIDTLSKPLLEERDYKSLIHNIITPKD